MALDSQNKRASALGVAVATFALVLPNPDGAALNQGDRQQVAFAYRGIAASAAAALTAGAGATLKVPADDPTLTVYRAWDAATIRVSGDDPTFTIED